MSIPQKKAMLHYCVERATHADLTKIMESIGKRQAKRKISDAKLKHEFRAIIPNMSVKNLDAALAAVDPVRIHKRISYTPGPMAVAPQPQNIQNSTLGYVIYEKLNYEDKGIVKTNDVVSQFILPPGGEVEVEYKSWSKVTIDFEETMSQLNEEELESSLSQNKELSESTSKQQQYNMSLSTSFEAGGGIGIFSVSGKIATNISSAVTLARQESTKEKQEITQKAASRSRKEHKLTVKRATEFGTETNRREKFQNHNKFQPVSYKFFKAAKEWEIRHEIYNLALCADVMVRNPGVNLRKLLAPKFDPSSVPSLNYYYPGEEIDQEPLAVIKEQQIIETDASTRRNLTFMLGIGNSGPVSFGVPRGGGDRPTGMIAGDKMGLWYDQEDLRGHGVYNCRWPDYTKSSKITLTAIYRRKDEIYNAWLTYAKDKLLEIYKRNWELEQDLASAKRKALDEERDLPVQQILRQQERNELASGVAQFILTGISSPEPLNDEYMPMSVDLGQATGRIISMIHHSFEWHNASYFLYPYWWDFSVFESEDSMTMKDVIEIDHKDGLRKSFMQSSWARVLVPVREGSERDILKLMYGATIDTYIDNKLADLNYIAPEHADIVNAYVSLYNERTNGRLKADENLSDAANPLSDSNVKQAEPIVLATWKEYTPTDETFAEMSLLQDAAGVNVKLGEDEAISKDTAETERSEAVTTILQNIKDKVGNSKISVNLGTDETAEVKSEVS